MPKVSVLIPTYNYAHFLGETIQSVLDQTFADFELIIIDDGSTDNTREVVGSFKDLRIKYIYQENQKLSAAENTGIRASSGQYIAILGADDLWMPENLELKVKLLDSRPDIALVCSDGYYFESKTGATLAMVWHDEPSRYHVDPRSAAQQPMRELLTKRCFIMPQTAVMRRLVFDKVGYFDESIPTCDDWDLYIRIVQHFSIETIDIPLARIRRHTDNMTASRDNLLLGEVTAFNKAIRSHALSREEVKLLQRRRKRLAPELLSYSRRAMRSGKLAAGRKALIAAIRVKPWDFKPYLHFVLALLGNKNVIVFKLWKKWMGSPASIAR